MNGFTDKPLLHTEEDILEVKPYIEGLCSFITECNTPMTIAIQGDWGSGKTSMMNMIKEQLGDKVATSWFNTWQYSQFNMDDTLTVSLLSRLIADLEKDMPQKNEKVKKALNFIYKIAKTGSVIVTNAIAGDAGAEALNSSLQEEHEDMDMPQAINSLKDHFQAAVNEKIKPYNAKRLVVFIDDLDRLHPGKAVELLEVLKLFLDCDNCVFVLAIDYAVVSQGVKQKYGELIGEEKGKSFFDKIIQVPFKMPVAQYNIKEYVSKSLKEIGISLSEKEADVYVKLIQNSIGCNPRAIKRLFNTFLLLTKVSGTTITSSTDRKVLFAILCLQLSFEDIYNYIVKNPEDCYDNSLLKDLTNTDTYIDGNNEDNLSREIKLSADDITRAVEFMKVFNQVIDRNGDGTFSNDEINKFIKILGFSTITASTSPSEVAKETPESHYRYFNRNIIKDTLKSINSKCSADFKVYQVNTERKNWKKYYAAGEGYIQSPLGRIGIEYKIETDIQNHTSKLSVWIYYADKRSLTDFRDTLKKWNECQTEKLVYLEEYCGFYLDNKTIDCDARDSAIDYFRETVPSIVNSLENYLNEA